MLILMTIGVLSRLIPHPANMTAVGGLAVFSGSRFGRAKALLVVVATMLISDLLLGFHSVMWATYGSLALAILLGRLLQNKRSVGRIAGITLASSLIFYLITNFAVWAIPGSMYPKTIQGLLQSYIMALPFFRNSLVGDFLYATVFFGGYEIVATLQKQQLRLISKVRTSIRK